jgi:putative nucleotidyltransferase with HDIG domain
VNQASLDALTVALDLRDAYTRGHCDRVVALALALAAKLDVAPPELGMLRICALFHDVGKIGVPDAVLLKPGRLAPEEWEQMKSHAEHGEKIVRATGVAGAERLADVIRHHHESFDGSGYPDGLRGEAIPLLCRILLVVDAYDAMGSGRPYHRPRSHAQIMAILESESGSKLDPEVFRPFAALIARSPMRVQ